MSKSDKSKEIVKEKVYSVIFFFEREVLERPLHIAKPFIDQFKLEKFSYFRNHFFTEEGEIEDQGTFISCSKETVLYYLLKFHNRHIPQGVLTPDDVLYLINNGYPESRLENRDLKMVPIPEFLKAYRNIKSQSISTIKDFIPSVLTELITTYIS